MFAGPAIRIIYPDGSCLNCQFGAARNPAFEPGGTVISLIQHGGATLDKIDGIPQGALGVHVASDAVWSAAGWLAVVRGGVIWTGRPGRLRRIGAGSDPSWSPDGTMIAAAQRGWIVIIRLRDRRVRRLVQGTAPAFAPDGRWIAYVAPDRRLMIVRASGARPASRRVGNIQAVSVDWQPMPSRSHPACVAPPGSRVLASSPAAVVTGDRLPLPTLSFSNAPPIAYMGCLRADGRERLLERFTGNTVDGADFVGSAVLAAPYAGLVHDFVDEHYPMQSSTLQIFDLRTGLLRPKLGGESVTCSPQIGISPCDLDQVVLGGDGVSAADSHEVAQISSLSARLVGVSCAPASTTCVAADPLQVLSSANPSGGAQAWTAATIAQHPLSDIDCPSTSLCVGSSDANIYTTTDPTGGATAWTSTALAGPPTPLEDLSCPSTNLCVAIRADGSVATSSAPAGGTSAWSISLVDSNLYLPLAVFCSTRPECFISNSTAGPVYSSADSTGGAGAWGVSPSTPPFESGTCPTANFCAAVAPYDIQTTTDPAAGTWTQHAVATYLNSIACPSAALCLAVGVGGALYVSTDLASAVWTRTTIDAGRDLNSIACPSASLCVAVDSTGYVVTSADPTGGPSAWTPALIDGDPCAASTPCSVEQIQASDATGRHTFDSSETPGTGPFLTGLTLTGDVLSWNHNGTQRSVTLTP